MRFSVIVPVYNVEKYLPKCLDSILKQTNQDFEVLVVNDGTKDNSQKIIDEYVREYPQKIKSFIKPNGGLSDARNYGVERANGQYLVFVDSDDYIDEKLLEKLEEEIVMYPEIDVVSYNFVNMNEKYEKIGVTKKTEAHNLSGEDAIITLVNGKQCFDPACGFAYRLEFWKNNDFKYMKGIYHEDFALTPLVVLKADKVSFLDFEGYYYIMTSNSIMRNNSSEKAKKSANDLLKAYDYLCDEVNKITFKNEYSKALFMSYISNSVIFKLEMISGELKKEYRKELIKRNVFQYVMSDTFKRKIRKLLIKIKCRL